MNPPLSELSDSNPRRYFKYNFASLLDRLDSPTTDDSNVTPDLEPPLRTPPKKKAPTIQFRRPKFPVDNPDIMVHWVRLLGALVEFAGKIKTEALLQFLGAGHMAIQNPEPPPHRPGCPISLFESISIPYLYPLVGSANQLLDAMKTNEIKMDDDTTAFWRSRAPSRRVFSMY